SRRQLRPPHQGGGRGLPVAARHPRHREHRPADLEGAPEGEAGADRLVEAARDVDQVRGAGRRRAAIRVAPRRAQRDTRAASGELTRASRLALGYNRAVETIELTGTGLRPEEVVEIVRVGTDVGLGAEAGAAVEV